MLRQTPFFNTEYKKEHKINNGDVHIYYIYFKGMQNNLSQAATVFVVTHARIQEKKMPALHTMMCVCRCAVPTLTLYGAIFLKRLFFFFLFSYLLIRRLRTSATISIYLQAQRAPKLFGTLIRLSRGLQTVR